MERNGMEQRNGSWTSQTKARDLDEVINLVRKIRDNPTSPQVADWARRAEHVADGVRRELRG